MVRLISLRTYFFFFSSRRRHTRCSRDWSSDVCSSDLAVPLLELLGIAALVGSVLLFLQMQDFNPTLYQGGDLAAAFCFTVLIAAVAHPRLGIGQALGIAPLRWIGERSYGIYLWHWPIILLVAGVNARPSPGVVVGEAAIVV